MSQAAPESYYERIPEPGLHTGDIWSDLPTFGLLPQSLSVGILISPACDLANAKTETVTYLPVVPVLSWCRSRAFLREMRGAANSVLGELLVSERIPLQPDTDSLLQLEEALDKRGALQAEPLGRVRSAIRCVQFALGDTSFPAPPPELFRSAFGAKKWRTICEAIVKNSHSPDVHFLPAMVPLANSPEVSDPQKSVTLPQIAEHSVVLFRYPLTIPIDVLISSETCTTDWVTKVDALTTSFVLRKCFRDRQPIKFSRLKKDFLVDLLTRFAQLYLRLGSPDFPKDTVDSLASALENGRTTA